jgi:REP element-mobilizing transposase RayT
MSLPGAMVGKVFLPISNPQLNGMDTHYHFFIETPSVKLSKIMQHINGAYTTYFNRKRERSGHLFQGRN